MSERKVCVTGSAIRIKIAFAVAESMSIQEVDTLAKPESPPKASRGKGKTRKQWEVGR